MCNRIAALYVSAASLLLAIPTQLSAQTNSRFYDRFSGLQEVNPPAAPQMDKVVAILNARVVDVVQGRVDEDYVVVIKGNKVAALGNRSQVDIPASAENYDASGCTVLPGLIDSHFHTGSNESTIHSLPELFLRSGVTTARDPGRPIDVYTAYMRGDLVGPRLFLTGPHFDQPPPAYPDNAVLLASPAEAVRAVNRFHKQGASGIKVYFRLEQASVQATCTAAHKLGIPVTAHLELLDADSAIAVGLDGVEHITSFGSVLADPEVAEKFQASVDEENEARREGRYRLWATLQLDQSEKHQGILNLIVNRAVFVSPTLATFERRAGGQDVQEYHVRGFENMLKFTGLCHKAGAMVVTGSHTWSRHVEMGWAFQREMELLLESGLSPMEVLKASTINNAKFLGCADRLGSIEVGKLADLVVVQGDPLQNMKAMYQIRRVMLNGSWLADKTQTSDK